MAGRRVNVRVDIFLHLWSSLANGFGFGSGHWHCMGWVERFGYKRKAGTSNNWYHFCSVKENSGIIQPFGAS